MVSKRVIIIDFAHMTHIFWHSGFGGSVTVIENGVPVLKSTRVQYGSIRNVYNWSNHGANPTAICFDRPAPARKQWFAENFQNMEIGSGKEYKGNRESMPSDMYEAVQDCERLLRQGGVSCFASHGYEADDLVFACIQEAKKQYPDLPIDVITNDADLLPLVDERVSVFIRSMKGTYAESKELEKNKYIQVTPSNFQEVVENLSAYKGFNLPYNTILLHKLLRGDTSDNINGIKRRFAASKFNKMLAQMEVDGVDFAKIFRYGVSNTKLLYKGTDEVFEGTMKDALASPDKALLYQKIYNTPELDEILNVLDHYTGGDEEVLTHVKNMYWGMNLNQIYPNKDRTNCRRAYKIEGIHDFNEFDLQKAVTPLQIRLIK